MAAANTDYFTEVGNPGTATTLAAPGHSISGTTFNVISTANWPTTTGAIFAVDTFTIQTINGVATAVRTPGSYTEWEGVVTNSTTISTAVIRYGTDQNYPAGSNTRVYIPVASTHENRTAQGIQLFANQDGSLKTTAVQAALGLTNLNGYTPLGQVPSSVTYNGNRSYDIVLPTDLTSVVSNGMRLRTTRTVAAPTQCTSLNGTSQYYSKTTPAGMTFTDDFVVGAWVKLTSYASSRIISRYNGTSGWELQVTASGQLLFAGYNGGGGNSRYFTTAQSLPLNKWVHIAAQLDMSTYTATPTTMYCMIDGVDVPIALSSGGTNPTSLVQAGNLEIGSTNGGAAPFPGKIAQAFVTNAKVTQAIIRSNYINQSISPTETSLVSAYSFNNSINDLNTTNANNLTANGAAVATNADSPFTQDDTGTPSGTNDFAIVTKKVFSTNTTITVQVPEGCTIPTIGGVSAVVYSSNKAPFGFPNDSRRFRLSSLIMTTLAITSNASYGPFQNGGFALTVTPGPWKRVGWQAQLYNTGSALPTWFNISPTPLTGLSLDQGSKTSRYGVISYCTAGSMSTKAYSDDSQFLTSSATYVMYTYGASTSSGLDGSTTHEIFADFEL